MNASPPVARASRQGRFPPGKVLAFSLPVLLVGLVLVCLALELLLRVLHLPLTETRIPSENAMARYDEELGWSYLPNHSVRQEFGSERRSVAMHFDAIGSRVASPGTRRNPQAPTLLLVGCSYAFGHGLPYEESVAGHLDAMAAPLLQVVNLAVQGYGTDQSLLMLKRRFHDFDTKVVVYICMCDHVVRNANYDRRILAPRARVLGTKPRFALERDGTLRLIEKPLRTEELTYWRLWASFRILWARWGPRPSLDLSRALLEAMREYSESNGAVFLVVFWDGDPYPGLNLNLIDSHAGAPEGWDTWRIPGDSHPDGRAHQRVAGLIHARLQELGVLPE